jgi:hypothetical protein
MCDLTLTSESLTNNYLTTSEHTGKHLYKNNRQYRSIVNCMEHPEFRKLFDEHFSNLDNIKNILMFLKLYEQIEKSSNTYLNGYQKLAILDKLMKNQEFRHNICKEISNTTNLLI